MSTRNDRKAGSGVLVLAATAGEARAAARAIRLSGRTAQATVESIGVGPEKAEHATRELLDRSRPAIVLLVGVAGGLAPDLAVGDVVIPTSHRFESEPALTIESRLVQRLSGAVESIGLAPHSGHVLTSDRVLSSPEEKSAAHEAGFLAVEMEGYAVARCAAQAGIAFASIRTVLDPVGHRLPDLTAARDGEGRARIHRLPRAFIVRPRLFLELLAFVSVVPRAQAALTRSVAAALPVLPS